MSAATECILTFHGVGEPPHEISSGEAHVWLAEQRFLEILDALKDRPDVRITFDDGNASDARIVAPALADRDLTATFFVCSQRFGKPGYITANEAKHLTTLGHTVGSHGAAHVPWRRLSKEGIETEVFYARAQIEDAIGGQVAEAACPFGVYDRRTLGALRKAGFARVFTSDGGHAPEDAWLAPRTTIRSVDNALSVTRILDGGRRGLVQRAKTWIKAHR
jgi:peptidoglycan/xylan/chitin deacetylase (PgdA/CDA1 family)